MKKMLLLSVITVMASTSAFAQFVGGNYFGARGVFAFMPELQIVHDPAEDRDTDNDFKIAQGQHWGGTIGRVELLFRGNRNNMMGYELVMVTDNGNIFNVDKLNGWIRPYDWMQVTFGKFVDDRFKGRIGPNQLHYQTLNGGLRSTTGNLNRFSLSTEVAIFGFIEGGNVNGSNKFGGAMLNLTPVKNLYTAFALPQATADVAVPAWEQSPRGGSAKDAFSRGIAYAGYTIPGIGLARVGYFSRPTMDFTGAVGAMSRDERYANSYIDENSRIEAAFLYQPADNRFNLTIDAGLKFAFPTTQDPNNPSMGLYKITYNPGIIAAIGMRMDIDNFRLTFLKAGHYGNKYRISGGTTYIDKEETNGVNVNFYAIPQYTFDFGIVGLNFGVDILGKDAVDGVVRDNTGQTNLGFGAWFRKDFFRDTYLIIGLTYTHIGVIGGGERAPNTPSGYFRLPIVMEVNFQ